MKCGSEIKVLAMITDPFEVNKIKEYLKTSNSPSFDMVVTKVS